MGANVRGPAHAAAHSSSRLPVTDGPTDLVTFFPAWRGDPYLDDLATELAHEGWQCKIVGRKGLMLALIAAAFGRGTVHLHWFEGFTPRRRWVEGLVAWMYLPALWLAGRRGRLVWTVHNVTPHDGYAALVGPRFLALLARSCARILVHFDETRAAVEATFSVRHKVFVVPPAYFGHVHGPPIDRETARAGICEHLTEGTKLFVQIGSLRRYKHPATTVMAFRDAAPSSAMLLVSGQCDDDSIRVEILRAAAGDPRIVVGFARLQDHELVAALCAADWSISPYSAIDNPGAVNLAVSYNCPVIAPSFPSVNKLTLGHPAILYRADGIVRERLADAIVTAISKTVSITDATCVIATRRDQAIATVEQYFGARQRL